MSRQKGGQKLRDRAGKMTPVVAYVENGNETS